MESTSNNTKDCEPSTSKGNDDSQLTEIQRIDKILDEKVSKKISMLNFERQIFIDCVYSDGTMVVVAKGISYERVLLNLFEAYIDPSNLIIVLNCDDQEEKYLTKLLDSPHIHQASNNSNEREKVYLSGGIFFISTQILVLDFLKNKIPAELITGIFVLRAHKVIESCQEAFALRLYRQKNKTGFIKAFTASPESFMYGFGQMEKVMRNLFVADLFIWPRFHARIQKDFKPNEPLSVEFSIPLSPKMEVIQKCLLELMNFLVEELKRINPYLDLEEVTVENCATKKFNKILEAQLDHVWHQLNPKTKLLITDLKILRNLMFSAVYNDAVSFYAYLRKYRTAEYAKNNSGWTLSDTAEKIFVLSKERVFNKNDEFEPEFPPKWKALSEILCTEIPSHIKKMADDEECNFDKNKPIRILILCNDAKTAHQLNQYLTQGLERTLFWTALRNDVNVQKLSAQYKNIPMGGGSGNVNEAVRVNQVNLNRENSNDKNSAQTSNKMNLKMKENKKVVSENEEDIEREIQLAEAIFKEEQEEQVDFCDSYTLTMTQQIDNDERLSAIDFDSSLAENFKFDTCNVTIKELDELKEKESVIKPAVFIQTFRSDENRASSLALTLQEMQPDYVIMYNMNIAAIRQIETFEARMQRPPKERLIGYVLMHGKTVEEQGFLTGIRREKKAFEHLIQTKKTMIVPEYQLGKRDVDEIVKRRKKEVNNRDGAAEEKEDQKLIVIVDSREFRSELPSLLHRRGFEIVPAMITIGDYILTPQICVERKSISDLIGSLHSGRLFNQCQQMNRYYESVVLLIEFDQNRPFHLLGRYTMTREYEMSSTELIQKLQILTIHFPRLRIIWSPSPYATAQIFEDLKKNKENPSIEIASQIGTDEGGSEYSQASEKYNNEIYDFLLKLPGVNSKNIHNLMKKGKSLKNLITLKENELIEILGNSKDAKILYDILHNVIKPAKQEKQQRKAPSLAQRYFRKM